MLVEVDSEYKIYSERLRALEKQFYDEKSHSVWFYLQAFKCYREKSSSLKKLGMFEVRVLLFAVKHKLMTRELALYTANLASQMKVFDKQLYAVLVGSYKMNMNCDDTDGDLYSSDQRKLCGKLLFSVV